MIKLGRTRMMLEKLEVQFFERVVLVKAGKHSLLYREVHSLRSVRGAALALPVLN